MSDINQTTIAVLERPGRIGPRRAIKLQVCLTAQERAQLAEQARAGGYDSVSAFVRAAALGGYRRA
jgi:hypothetical protein